MCDSAESDIQCPQGQVIVVMAAIYGGGLPGSWECAGPYSPCPQVDATDYYIALCGGRQNCTVGTPRGVFENPCQEVPYGVSFTQLQYDCDGNSSGGGGAGVQWEVEIKTNVRGNGTYCDDVWGQRLAESMVKALTSLGKYDAQRDSVTHPGGCQVEQAPDGGLVASYSLTISLGRVSEPRRDPTTRRHLSSTRRPCAVSTPSVPGPACPPSLGHLAAALHPPIVLLYVLPLATDCDTYANVGASNLRRALFPAPLVAG